MEFLCSIDMVCVITSWMICWAWVSIVFGNEWLCRGVGMWFLLHCAFPYYLFIHLFSFKSIFFRRHGLKFRFWTLDQSQNGRPCFGCVLWKWGFNISAIRESWVQWRGCFFTVTLFLFFFFFKSCSCNQYEYLSNATFFSLHLSHMVHAKLHYNIFLFIINHFHLYENEFFFLMNNTKV